ncbi:hypothetical protein BH11MYX2_BH11MYX2_18280 [soil metagenome]
MTMPALAAVPASPGAPPKLSSTKAMKSVVLVDHGVATELTVLLTGRDTWTLVASAKEVEITLTLSALKGTEHGANASLARKSGTPAKGAWIVAIDKADVGYLKLPGVCSGRIAATFAKDVYVVGTFSSAGCISYDPKP